MEQPQPQPQPQLQPLFTNTSSYLPSPADLLLVFPRLLSKAGAWGEHIDTVFEKIRAGGSIIAEPTAINTTINATIATAAAAAGTGTGGFALQDTAAASVAAQVPDDITMFQALKNIGSFFGYVTSKWAIATFAIVSPVRSCRCLSC